MKKNLSLIADEIAIPFWLILIVYSLYEISIGNNRAYIVLVTIFFALVIDSLLVYRHKRRKR